MTNAEWQARGFGTIPSQTTPVNASNSTEGNWGNVLGDVLSTTAKGLQDTYSGYVDAQIAAANMANSASAQAQKNQFIMNQELMNLQNTKQDEYLQRMFDFNTHSAAEANAFTEKMFEKAKDYNTNMFNAENAFNEKMWKKSADYNSSEAKLQRAWQEEMSATAYQRAIKDMKAAGINPILAAMNGGANVGSGSTASIGSISSSSKNMGTTSGAQAQGAGASAAGGSVGNYSGQGYHLSDTMAIMGSALGVLGSALTGLQASNFFGKTATNISNALENVSEGITNQVREIKKEVNREVHNWATDSYGQWLKWTDWDAMGWAKGKESGGGWGHSF